MNTETQTDLDYKISVMQAYKDGKKIQCRGGDGWITIDKPSWNWNMHEYRIAPGKNKVPMTAEDFPPVFWVRETKNESWWLVTRIYDSGLWAHDSYNITFENLMKRGWVYSTDRKEAKPCYKYE